MTSHALTDAFEGAKKEFLSRLPKGTPSSFEGLTTINDVYKAAEEIQAAQAKKRTTRNLRKIQPFLECLRHYGEVIETFVTVKPDILALIWGPIKFVLLTSSTYLKSFDKLVDVMAQIGHSLPSFEKYTALFQGDRPIQQVLGLFYQDILDLYITLLDFFRHTGWKSFFDALWPKSAERIRVITENIKEHKLLMDDSITLAHVVEAHAARQRAFEEFERQHEFRKRQDLEAVKSSLSPVLYDRHLQRLKARRIVRSGDWLLDQKEYNRWIDPSDESSRLLWLQGIPGAGKTFLSSSIIEYIAERGDPMVFAFLDYQSRDSISTLQLLHSFIWQMALDNEQLQDPLILAHKQEYRRLNSDLDFVKDLFGRFLESLSTTFIIIDGLDEITQLERCQILRFTLENLQMTSNIKVLISSRPEDDISNIVSKEAQPLRVHDCNNPDIEAYVSSRAASLVSDASISDSGLAPEISTLMKKIAAKAEGMFLYARLVCDSIYLLGDIDSIKEAVENLPNGLNEAYDRILSRIKEGLPMRQREDARQILALITCCVVPLSKNEIQLAVYTAQGGDPSKGCKGLFLNILARCGPIIEEIDGIFRFVHFSAREYLLSPQSNHYLTESAGHACVASTCITYLNSACFDVDSDDSALSLYIHSGAFVLLAYVCSHWLHHIGKVERQDLKTLTNDIECLLKTRVNPRFETETIVCKSQDAENFQPLSSVGEETDRMLCMASAFSKKRKRDLSFQDGEDWTRTDPFTFTETEAKFGYLLESMLCDSVKHRSSCPCQELMNIYGSDIYKCGRPGCKSYRIGFGTKLKRVQHMQRHTRPFKCQHSECPFADLGFIKETDLNSHTAQYHHQNLHAETGATQGQTNASSKEELKAILIDAVQENDLPFIQKEAGAVRKVILDLILSAYQGRSSDAMIKHLLRELPPDIAEVQEEDPWERLRGEVKMMDLIEDILRASIDHGNYDVFRVPHNLFHVWVNGGRVFGSSLLRDVGRTRRADLVEMVTSGILEIGERNVNVGQVYLGVVPTKPDTHAEMLALECFERTQTDLSKYSDMLLLELARGCCSIIIAEFLLAKGAAIDPEPLNYHQLSSKPLFAAARQTSREAAILIEFLVRRGRETIPEVAHTHYLAGYPGPKNIQKWIGITWGELLKQNYPTVEASSSGEEPSPEE